MSKAELKPSICELEQTAKTLWVAPSIAQRVLCEVDVKVHEYLIRILQVGRHPGSHSKM
jgi:hypothetical protein